MKLRFDENRSSKLPHLVRANFPESEHVREAGLKGQTDGEIWDYAKTSGFTIFVFRNDREAAGFWGNLGLRKNQRLHGHFERQRFLPARPAVWRTTKIHLAAARQASIPQGNSNIQAESGKLKAESRAEMSGRWF